MTIESVVCPVHNARMKRASGIHGPYWRCPKWGCEQKADKMGEIIKPRRDEDDEDNEDNIKKRRRWEE